MSRVSLALVSKLLEFGFDTAIRIDRWLDERKAKKAKGLTFKDVQHQQSQIARATRSRAPTVTIPRAEADAPPPTVPSTPARRR